MKDDNQRVLNIAKKYDSIADAERYLRKSPPTSLWDRIRDWQLSIVLAHLGIDSFPSPRPRGLDIGCSSGRYSAALMAKGISVIGIDTAAIPLGYAAKRIREASFFRASAIDLPFEKESFDLVICIELLHHFSDDVLEKGFREISRITKPGGTFVFDLKNSLNPIMWYRYQREDSVSLTLKVRTIHQMVEIAERNGFEVILKKGILFPITYFAPFVILFARKGG